MMRATRITSFGPVKQGLHVADVACPAAQPGRVLVKVLAAGVNPSDVKNVSGSFRDEGVTLPRIPGRDFAGIVRDLLHQRNSADAMQVVDGPAHLLQKEVFGTGGRRGWDEDGTHAQLVSVPESEIIFKPSNLTILQAAVVGVPFLTAWTAANAGGVAEGKDVVVIGARGAVGSATSQICKAKRARVIGAVRGKAATLPAKGSDASIADWLALEEDLDEQVKALTRGQGADIVIDTVGGAAMVPTALKLLGTRGTLVEMSATGGAQVSLDIKHFYRHELRLVGVNTLNQTTTESAQIFAEIARAFADGTLSPPQKIRALPLEQAVEAYEAVEAGSNEKVVLLPNGSI